MQRYTECVLPFTQNKETNLSATYIQPQQQRLEMFYIETLCSVND